MPNSVNRVLVVEDEAEVREALSESLHLEGFNVESVVDGEEALKVLPELRPHIILMDYRLPGVSGVDVVRTIRKHHEFNAIPIIMVTGLDGEDEKVAALELGADDYMVKPFSPKELSARIRAVLRRVSQNDDSDQTLEMNGLSIDLKAHRVLLMGSEVHLTLTEYRILVELVRGHGQVLSRDQLRETALGNLNVTDRTIDVHMASLRKKLSPLANSFQTVRGVGYRFN